VTYEETLAALQAFLGGDVIVTVSPVDHLGQLAIGVRAA